MTVRRIKDVLLRMLCLWALAFSMTGCLKEDLSDCFDSYTFKVKAYNNEGAELSRDDVSDVILYVFDSDMRFMERINTHVGESVTIKSSDNGSIHVVGWGNLGGDRQSHTTPAVGDHKDDLMVELLSDTRLRSTSFLLSPDDLFHGEITVSREKQSGEKILPIYRKAGSMTITVRNLKNFTGYDDDDFSIVVRETYSQIDFYGNLTGEKAAYRPDGSFVTNGNREEYYVPPFNMMPSAEIFIDIYHGSELIISVSSDSQGNAITVEEGLLTNVLIDLKALLNVSLTLTDWGNEQYWKEF